MKTLQARCASVNSVLAPHLSLLDAERRSSMDAFRRVHAAVADAASCSQQLKQTCSDVQVGLCRNFIAALSSRCRRLRQSKFRRAFAFASVNSPHIESQVASDKAQVDGHASGVSTKPGQVSGALWGPRGARAPTSDSHESTSQQDTP